MNCYQKQVTRRITSLVLLAGLVAAFSLIGWPVVALAGDWPQWLGPSRNSVSTEAIEPWSDSPPVLWRKPVGGGFSVPVAANGVVYVHSSVAGSDAEQVTAFDLSTGDEKW